MGAIASQLKLGMPASQTPFKTIKMFIGPLYGRKGRIMAGRSKKCSVFGLLLMLVAVVLSGTTTSSETVSQGDKVTQDEVKQLRQMVQELAAEVKQIKESQGQGEEFKAEYQKQLQNIRDDVTKLNESPVSQWSDTLGKINLGGYGEIHSNFTEGTEKDQFDIHRLVLYLGYDFSDWIKFHSETELEHAFVNDGDGEVSIEQAYFDFLLSDLFNVRAGRVLTPIGIINKYHEPTLFNGVERPSFATSIIPTTWSSDGIGIFGNINPSLSYGAYVVAGLDGSGFNAISGIRGGRIKERPSLNEPAFTARLDYYPFIEALKESDQSLRFGLSGYFGGLDNGDQGSNPGIDGEIAITSADFEYSRSKFDFRGAVANIDIDGARQIGNGTAEQMFGWYLEGGYHFWPQQWKTGKLAKSDAVAFVRYDNFDTQHKMPSGISRNPAGDREEWTVGVSFFPVSNLVIKADYQIRDDDSGGDLDDLFNVGIGWTF
jgi:hypothetical protein